MAASTSLSDLVIERPVAKAPYRFTRGFPDFDPALTQQLIAHLVESGAQVIEDQMDAAFRLVRLQSPRRHRLALRSHPNRTLQIDGVHGDLVIWALDFLRTVMPLDRILAQQVARHRLGDYFEPAGGQYALRAIYATEATLVQRMVLNRCYHLWHSARHGLFHMDGVLESTLIIEDRVAAIQLVNEVLSTIDDSCRRLLKGSK